MDESIREQVVLAADLAKVHNRINQAVNQRFLLTGADITILGFLITPFLQSFDGHVTVDSLFRATLISNVYFAVTCGLVYQSMQIRLVIRMFATYLTHRNLSQWESDWRKFRSAETPAIADQRAHYIIFRFTALLGPLVPFIETFVCHGIIFSSSALIQAFVIKLFVIISIPLNTILYWLIIGEVAKSEEDIELRFTEKWKNMFRSGAYA